MSQFNIKNTKNFFYNEKIFPDSFSLEEFEKAFSDSRNILRDDRNVIKRLYIGETETIIKSFKTPNFIQGIIYKFFRKSKARRSYENSLLLNQRGIHTPEPLGYIEVFSRFRLQQSYFISRKLEYDFTLDYATSRESEDYQNILKKFIHFTHELHKKNIMHLDYCVTNICIKKIIDGYEFYLVDLNRLREGTVSIKNGIKNLARISKDPKIIEILSNEYAI